MSDPIEIYKNAKNMYEGKIVWLAEPLDENGENKKKRRTKWHVWHSQKQNMALLLLL